MFYAANANLYEYKASCKRMILSNQGESTSKQIRNYIMRTCGAHSWYKHMSLLNASYSFQFILKPYVNMRLIDNKYIEYLEDDGTRFHYTWTTTKKYRER